MSAISRVLWHRLDREMREKVGADWTQRPIHVYGAGGLGRSFMQTFPQLRYVGALDSDAKKVGRRFEGLPIATPDTLDGPPADDGLIFITSSWHEEIRRTLEARGLEADRDFFYGNQQAHGRLFFYLHDLRDFERAFAWMDEAQVEYVILRWFETLPEERPGDIDLLVRTGDLPRLFDHPLLSSEPGGIPIEVYWSEPLGHEDELLYYPTWLADEILCGRERKPCGAWGPAPWTHLRSLAYHVVFHKAERAGLPRSDEAETGTGEPREPNKYRDALRRLARDEGAALEATLDGLWTFLDANDWLPPLDLARRYATTLDSEWLHARVAPLPEGPEDLLVFVLREWLVDRPPVLSETLDRLEALGLRRIDVLALDAVERARAEARIRGGNWVESEASRQGGGPAALAIFRDTAPIAPSVADRLLRPFVANARLAEKTALKTAVAERWHGGRSVNFLHAADDTREALEYLDCLQPERRGALAARIEQDRLRTRKDDDAL